MIFGSLISGRDYVVHVTFGPTGEARTKSIMTMVSDSYQSRLDMGTESRIQYHLDIFLSPGFGTGFV